MFITEILVKGKLDPAWSDWFEDLQVQACPTGDTLLTGSLPDRSAVYGVISRLGNLGMTLISLTFREADDPDPQEN